MQTAKVLLTDNARRVLEKRYLKKDTQGHVIENPHELFLRVSRNIAQADLLYDKDAPVAKTQEKFYAAISGLYFLPNSPTLMNAGRELQQLSACFVIPVDDSMESIFEAIKNTALIHRSGGGTGFSFSRLRPQNSMVKTTGGIASGPVSFMKVFDAATQAVKQGGTRRGANMGILRVDHPDILEFIKCKESDKDITNFNISVALTENFMDKVEKDEEYELIDPHTKGTVGTLRAKEVFELIVTMAWKNGEPGIIFLDRINASNPTPKIGQIESTNPCGEQPLLPFESCNLGSINLSRMVTESDGTPAIDWILLKETVHTAVHFLDNVIDMNKFPLPEIENMTKANRKIGLGVMGFADMLIALGIPYNSEEALRLAEKLMSFVYEHAQNASRALAKKRGVFSNFALSVYADQEPIRNATLTTIAPTGSLSIIASCSSGIEPLFALSYYRQVLDNEKLVEVNPYFEKVARERGFYSEELMKKVTQEGSIQKIDDIPDDVKKVFVTAHDITPFWHIKMQAAFQKYTDNAVSKTVNFPHDASKQDVAEVYRLAYTLACKGVTIYRDKSREVQVLNITKADAQGAEQEAEERELDKMFSEQKIAPRPRPAVMHGTTTKIMTGCGNLYITINEDENHQPFEIFTQMGKAGGCASSQLESIARLVSLAMRSGIQPKAIIEQLTAIRCPSPAWEKGGRIFSCADAIAKAIERRLFTDSREAQGHAEAARPSGTSPEAKTVVASEQKTTTKAQVKIRDVVGVCPDCGGALQYEEGCMLCRYCGYSKCG
jgi:ribonucleoside-diphosphate reductase alpha chain